MVVHFFDATRIDDALDVRHPDVFAPDAERDQQIEAREGRSPRAGTDELDVRKLFADDAQAVDDRRADNDRRAVLVIVKDRNLHPLAAFALDVETFRRLDVLEIDAAECRLERDDDVDQLVRIAFVQLDVEAIEAGEFLEQDGLALHHRLGRERSDGAETEDCGAVGDDTDQIGARGERRRFFGIANDFVASRSDAR